jgi:hypothetical protein
MWPNKAFHDQNFLPHSLHGRVIFGAVGSGFLIPSFGFETTPLELEAIISSILISFDRFLRRRLFSSRENGEEGKRISGSAAVVIEILLWELKGKGKKCDNGGGFVYVGLAVTIKLCESERDTSHWAVFFS